MNTTQMRNQVKQYIDKLSPKSLEIVSELLAYLVEKDIKDEQENKENDCSLSALELAGDLVGCVDANPDLSINKDYLRGFGES